MRSTMDWNQCQWSSVIRQLIGKLFLLSNHQAKRIYSYIGYYFSHLWCLVVILSATGCLNYRRQSKIDQAYEKGHQAGYNEGLVDGLKQAKEENLQQLEKVAELTKIPQPWFIEMKWVILLLGCLGLIFSFVLLMTVIRFRQTYNQKTFDQLTGYVKSSQKEFKELRSDIDLVKNSLLDLSVEVKRVLIDMAKFD